MLLHKFPSYPNAGCAAPVCEFPILNVSLQPDSVLKTTLEAFAVCSGTQQHVPETVALLHLYRGVRRQMLSPALLLVEGLWCEVGAGFGSPPVFPAEVRTHLCLVAKAWSSMWTPHHSVCSHRMVTNSLHSSCHACFILFRQNWMLLLNTQCITNKFVFSCVIIVFIVSINKYDEVEQSSAASSLKNISSISSNNQ